MCVCVCVCVFECVDVLSNIDTYFTRKVLQVLVHTKNITTTIHTHIKSYIYAAHIICSHTKYTGVHNHVHTTHAFTFHTSFIRFRLKNAFAQSTNTQVYKFAVSAIRLEFARGMWMYLSVGFVCVCICLYSSLILMLYLCRYRYFVYKL